MNTSFNKEKHIAEVKRNSHYLTNSSLQDGIKPSFGCISVSRNHLLLYLLIEAVNFVCERQDVAKSKGRNAVGEEFVSGYEIETDVCQRNSKFYVLNFVMTSKSR